MEWARSVTTSLAATAVTVRRATSMTPAAKSATVRMAVSGLWGDDEQIVELSRPNCFFEARATLEASRATKLCFFVLNVMSDLTEEDMG